MILETVVVTALGTNCYVLGCDDTRLGAVIDPGGDAPAILEAVRAAGLDIRYIINTHGHMDHIGANGPVRDATGGKLAVHELDAPMLTDPCLSLGQFMGQEEGGPPADMFLRDGDTLEVGHLRLRILHTPGHTRGGISLYIEDEIAVLTGDALFRGSIGRTDLPRGNHERLLESIRLKLLTLPDETVVYPGHGLSTTIGEERRSNPWL